MTRNGVSGLSLLGPDGTYRVTENSPPIVNVPDDTSVEIVPAAAPEPVADTTVDETSEPVATDTDGDGVADSDEVDLYGTDPGNWDSDGDDLSDSEELCHWDRSPLVGHERRWRRGRGRRGGCRQRVGRCGDTAPAVSDDAAASTTSVDSDNDRLADADEAAVGTDPTTPDADGDGYYDGDEVNLGTDPLDPASFPVG